MPVAARGCSRSANTHSCSCVRISRTERSGVTSSIVRHIGLAIAMRESGDILALGKNVRKEMADIRANLPVGIEPTLVADQAVRGLAGEGGHCRHRGFAI